MEQSFSLSNSIADHLNIGLFRCLFPLSKGFCAVNSAFARMLGYPSKAALKKTNLKNFFWDKKIATQFIEDLKKNKKVKFFEATFRTKDKGVIFVALTAGLTKIQQRYYLEGIVEDISSHKAIEEQLFLERDFLQGLLDNIPDAVYFKNRHNQIIKVNKFYAQGVKLKPEEIIGKTDYDFFPKDQADKMFADDNYVLRTGKPIVGKIERTLLQNGTWNQVITTKIPMYNRQGKIMGTMGITRDMTAYANLEKERLGMLINALTVLVNALEMRDPYTFSHVRHVANIAQMIAKELGWDENRLLGIRLAAELHDMGKISIPLDILNKPGKLSKLEYQLVQEHVKKCYDLIKSIKFPFSLADVIYQHHERLDGSGYPRGIKKNKILPAARILAVSDVLESMTCHRPYRETLGLNKALEELKRGAGKKYDAQIVRLVFKLVEKNAGKPFWLK